ncbi:MAG: hypothetical protein M3P00_06545 [Gemmatimonadota bacterium]|nr:hypothetical protein [Gemmatimonadota bacterium]
MLADRRPGNRGRRGFVIGELLIALLLLAVAVSSLAALMYSVSRRPATATREETDCVGKNATASPRCIAQAAGGPSMLLRSGCATRMGAAVQACKDSLVVADSVGETILKARTDSSAMALLEKKQKASRPVERPDRGFIR